jgi:hypothetical protein
VALNTIKPTINQKKKQKNTDKDLHNTTEKTEDLATGIQQTK